MGPAVHRGVLTCNIDKTKAEPLCDEAKTRPASYLAALLAIPSLFPQFTRKANKAIITAICRERVGRTRLFCRTTSLETISFEADPRFLLVGTTVLDVKPSMYAREKKGGLPGRWQSYRTVLTLCNVKVPPEMTTSSNAVRPLLLLSSSHSMMLTVSRSTTMSPVIGEGMLICCWMSSHAALKREVAEKDNDLLQMRKMLKFILMLHLSVLILTSHSRPHDCPPLARHRPISRLLDLKSAATSDATAAETGGRYRRS